MNTHPLLYFIFAILALGALCLSNLLYSIGVSYLISLPVLAVVLMIIYFIALHKLSKYDWYKEETDYEFKEYKAAYNSYQRKVLRNNQIYDIYVSDYCNSKIVFSVQVNQNGNISSTDYNFKNRIYHRIKGLLENRYDLVEKYFNKNSFGYKDYLELIKDYNTTIPIKTENQLLSTTEKIL